MEARTHDGPQEPDAPEELDVLVVGAGLSGIAAGHYLTTRHPQRSFAILEAKEALGGTWHTFRYPGIRSDSDLYTFGFAFRPWRDREAIAAGPRILAYLREAAAEDGLDARIRYRHRVVGADWSSREARWTVRVERTDTGDPLTIRARWILNAGGYFRHDRGYTPPLPGIERFRGRVVHPQQWPDDLDHAGARVVVVGSGATAVTLVPALATSAAHVTMLQRTPTYVLPIPAADDRAAVLRRVLGPRRAHDLVRRRNIVRQQALWGFCRRFPGAARRLLRSVAARHLPAGYPVDEHFAPPYAPWDQRLCFVPDGDLFAAIRDGRAEVVTDRIESFTGTGLRLASGRELAADLVVTATGLDLQAFGGMELAVDGRPVDVATTVAYRGAMLSGVPNFVFAVGYTHASWTLKVDLVWTWFARLLDELDARGEDAVWPEAEPGMATRPLLDLDAGYVHRAADRLPRQGTEPPWTMATDHRQDVRSLVRDPVLDGVLRFGPVSPS